MNKLPVAARVLYGLIFVVFGLNGFLHFIAQPPLPAPAGAFAGAMAATGYFFPLLKGTEVLAGALLLAGYVPLALLVLAPIVVNIVAFHGFLAPAGLGLPLVVLALQLYLAWVNRAVYARLFRRAPAAAAVPLKRPVAA